MTVTDGFDASDEDATTRALQARFAAKRTGGGKVSFFIAFAAVSLLTLVGLFVWSRAESGTFVFVGVLMAAAGLIAAFRMIAKATAH